VVITSVPIERGQEFMNRFMRSAVIVLSFISMLLAGCSPSIGTSKQALSTNGVQASEENKNDSNIDYNEQWTLSHINDSKALNSVKQRKEVKVAVVDTGVDYNHPDLKGRVLKDMGYNFINNSKDVMDDNWHGTHVAGIIAANAQNNLGISGVVQDFDVKIIPVKVLNNEGIGSSDIMAMGIKYAADMGADIINFSVGFDVKDSYIEEAIKYARSKGVFVVVSSGNKGINADNSSPAGDEGAYTVASINSEDMNSLFSNFGTSIKIAAPGEGILSTIPGGGYDYRNGTSMAAPFVAGTAAMMKAVNPSLSAYDIEKILNETAVDIGQKGLDEYTGYGKLDVKAAVEMAENYNLKQ
jgi:subtilisin family serine protease